MIKKLIIINLFTFLIGEIRAQIIYGADGQKYIAVDPKLVRGDISASQMFLKYADEKTRVAAGLHLKSAGRIISGFMSAKNKFAIRDEVYMDMTLGKLTSTPLTYFKDPESKLSVGLQFGYEILAGYRNERYAIMGGLKLQWSNFFVGSSEFSGNKLLFGTYPLMIRSEYRIGKGQEFRLAVMAWSNFSSVKNSSGANLDIPISKRRRLWFTVQYQYMTCPSTSPANVGNNIYVPGYFSQWFAGIKVGSIY